MSKQNWERNRSRKFAPLSVADEAKRMKTDHAAKWLAKHERKKRRWAKWQKRQKPTHNRVSLLHPVQSESQLIQAECNKVSADQAERLRLITEQLAPPR